MNEESINELKLNKETEYSDFSIRKQCLMSDIGIWNFEKKETRVVERRHPYDDDDDGDYDPNFDSIAPTYYPLISPWESTFEGERLENERTERINRHWEAQMEEDLREGQRRRARESYYSYEENHWVRCQKTDSFKDDGIYRLVSDFDFSKFYLKIKIEQKQTYMLCFKYLDKYHTLNEVFQCSNFSHFENESKEEINLDQIASLVRSKRIVYIIFMIPQNGKDVPIIEKTKIKETNRFDILDI